MIKLKLTQREVDRLVSVVRHVPPKRVFGVSVNDVGFCVRLGGKTVWQYALWKSMIQRCFDEKLNARQSTYKGVTCCDEWLSFGNFLEWCNKEVCYTGKPSGMDLDKDIIIRGNKVYSPEACSFVPQTVNKLLNSNTKARGEWPIGVCYHKRDRHFRAQLSDNGCVKLLGTYDTPDEAFTAYKLAKEAQIKSVALAHRASLKPVVFESLMNWSVEL